MRYRIFWGQKSANPALSVPDMCTLCLGVKYSNRARFKLFWVPLHAWFGVGTHFLKIGGGQINCSKNWLLFFLRAYLIFGARQLFETTFVHFENFCIWQIFPHCSPFALKTHELKWASRERFNNGWAGGNREMLHIWSKKGKKNQIISTFWWFFSFYLRILFRCKMLTFCGKESNNDRVKSI